MWVICQSDEDKLRDSQGGNFYSCLVGRTGLDVVYRLLLARVCVCLCVCVWMWVYVQERQRERESNEEEKERVSKGGMSCSPNHSARFWFIWQLQDGGLTTRGHLHQCPTSDPPQLLKWTQLSLLDLHPDRRDELLLGENAHSQTFPPTHTHTHTHTCLCLGRGKLMHASHPYHHTCESSMYAILCCVEVKRTKRILMSTFWLLHCFCGLKGMIHPEIWLPHFLVAL